MEKSPLRVNHFREFATGKDTETSKSKRKATKNITALMIRNNRDIRVRIRRWFMGGFKIKKKNRRGKGAKMKRSPPL